MPSEEALKALPADALWEFLKWLAFGQGRYVGIRIEPREASGDSGVRVRRLFEAIFRAPKQPSDAVLGVSFPIVDPADEDAALVTALAQYVAARNMAKYRRAADFEPQHVVEVQDDALRRIQETFRMTDG